MQEAKPWGPPFCSQGRLSIFQSNGLRKIISLDCTSNVVFLFNDDQASCIPKQKEQDKHVEIRDKFFLLDPVNHCFVWLAQGGIKHTVDEMDWFPRGFTTPVLWCSRCRASGVLAVPWRRYIFSVRVSQVYDTKSYYVPSVGTRLSLGTRSESHTLHSINSSFLLGFSL